MPKLILKRAVGFPVTPQPPVEPSDPADEKPRSYWDEHPENLAQRIERTRRYFRLCHRKRRAKFADGLEWHSEAR